MIEEEQDVAVKSWTLEEVAAKVAAVPESQCACGRCMAMCRLPCWPTPSEARALLDAGYAKRLMQDWWYGSGGPIAVLCPASIGAEGKKAPFWDRWAGCTMRSANGFCELHQLRDAGDARLKPWEGRVATCKVDSIYVGEPADKLRPRAALARLWNTDEGRALVARWEAEVRS